MNLLRETITLLTQPPGDLVYFLVTLFALQQALLPAITAYRRSSSETTPGSTVAKRWLWAIGGMLLGRVVLIIVGLLGSADVLDPVATLPPLERGLEVVNLGLVIWAMLGDWAAPWQTGVLIGLLTAAVGFYIYASQAWMQTYLTDGVYNGSTEELIWEIAALAVLGIGLLSQLLLRSREWEWTVSILIFWILGHVAQVFWPTTTLYFSDWERLSALIVFPMLAIYLHRRLALPQTEVAAQPFDTPATGRPPTAMDFSGLQSLLESVETARELEPSLLIASSQLADLLNADVCAIALTENADVPTLRVVATHPPTGALERPKLDLTGYDALGTAWMESEPRVIQMDESPWLPKLYQQLGFEAVASLLILPMRVHKKRTGLLLLGRPADQSTWQVTTVEAAHLTALLLAGSIDRVQRRGGSIFSLREREGYVLEELADAQAEIDALKQRVTALKSELGTRERDLARLRHELERRSEHVSETELKVWQDEIKELAKERDVLIKERNSLGKELAKVKSRFETLRNKYKQLQARWMKAQDELEANDMRNGSGLAVGLLVVDEDGAVRLADALARQLLALPEGEVVGIPVDGVYSDPAWAQTIDTLLTSDPTPPQHAHLTMQVREETLEADFVRLIGRDGQLDGLVITLKTEKSLAEQQEALIGLANEFRTPMTSLTGYIDLLLGEQVGILTEMQQQFLERVKASIEQMKQLLNDLIRLTSPDARRVDLVPQPIDLIHIIEQAIMGLSARFRERHLTVQLDLPPKLPPVQADRDSLYQIMLRLLSNAALCSEEGSGIVVSADLELSDETDVPPFIRISVTDTGGGIASEDLSKVFRRFFRAHQPLIEGMGERGVGMAIAKTLVEANGGRIWVDTEPGVGSTFSFVLPAHLETEAETHAVPAP